MVNSMERKPYVWEMVKEAITSLGGKASYTEIRNYIKKKYGDVNETTIRCQIIVCTVNHTSRIHYPENKKPRIANSKHDFLFSPRKGSGIVEIYDSEKHGVWEIRKNEEGKMIVAQSGVGALPVEEPKDETIEEELHFPVESHLRDFIAQNLDRIKVQGRTLSLYVDDSGNDGVEYRTDVGPIDILAVDEDDNFVVFELKLSRGHDSTMGQISRYMGWIKRKMAGDKVVKGVIVAKNVDKKLRYAASIIPDITLFEYEMDFKITSVDVEG